MISRKISISSQTILFRAWNGILNAIDFDGSIYNIKGETPINDIPEEYNPDSMFFEDSAPGIGAVIRAIAAFLNFESTIRV